MSSSTNRVIYVGAGDDYSAFPTIGSIGIPITNAGELSDMPLTVTFSPMDPTDILTVARFGMTLTVSYIDQD